MIRVSGPAPALAAAWMALATLLGCGGGSGGGACDLDVILRRRAGPGAVDCGRVANGASSTVTDQCIADRTAQGVAFFARYDAQGIDSQVAFGVISDGQGHASVLLWDSDSSGGSGAGAQIGETLCGTDSPIRTALTNANMPVPVSCGVADSYMLICG
jgi:hypothetical protein